jgi:2-keto-4-pentenoate hydratase/2-oxohepta-3-ene-1,7-dioic acid hydratase in catechol pathway
MDKIICVGKNYLEHAKELGDAVPEKPVLFLKPPSILEQAEKPGQILQVALPQDRGSVHHECEIVVRLKTGGSKMSLSDAQSAIGDLTLGLDMTLRDVQSNLKKNGHPWEISKVFSGSAIVGPWVKASEFTDYNHEGFSFFVDGQNKQSGNASQMRLSIAECIAYASEYFPLCAGDLLFTGTPAGVGPVASGQLGVLKWGDRIHYQVKWD